MGVQTSVEVQYAEIQVCQPMEVIFTPPLQYTTEINLIREDNKATDFIHVCDPGICLNSLVLT